MMGLDPDLDSWIARQAQLSTDAMLRAISATSLVKHRPGFGQTIVPRPGSVLASPVPASYDPDPDYFFHWYRDSAIVMDALRVARESGLVGDLARSRLREFVEFTLSLDGVDQHRALGLGAVREKVLPDFLRYVRDETEFGLSCDQVRAETRVNPDGTLDFTRWNRPQLDGPAMRAIVLLRWWAEEHDAGLRSGMRQVIGADLAFTLSRMADPSFDIWEEELGFHYYALLVQSEALAGGAEWFAGLGEPAKAEACQTGARELTSRLDGFWDPALGFYRSRQGGSASKALDAAVILAVNHAGRRSGRHSVLDPRTQAGLAALETLFDTDYAINHDRPMGRGPALGRYHGDAYYSGGAYYFTTLAAAEFYYGLSEALFRGEDLSATSENQLFLLHLDAKSSDRLATAEAVLRRGDSILRTVRAFTPASGELSEQFDRTTGEQTSAKHLTWSYAAFITAAASRSAAMRCFPA